MEENDDDEDFDDDSTRSLLEDFILVMASSLMISSTQIPRRMGQEVNLPRSLMPLHLPHHHTRGQPCSSLTHQGIRQCLGDAAHHAPQRRRHPLKVTHYASSSSRSSSSLKTTAQASKISLMRRRWRKPLDLKIIIKMSTRPSPCLHLDQPSPSSSRILKIIIMVMKTSWMRRMMLMTRRLVMKISRSTHLKEEECCCGDDDEEP